MESKIQPTLPARALQYIISTSKNHKKKLIALVIVVIVYRWCKKNVGFNHIVYVVQKLSYIFSLASYLPLPQNPTYREVAVYRHFVPKKCLPITNLMQVQKISQKIKQKQQGSWNQLKISVFTGVIMSLILYDLRSFFKTVQTKYIQDFKSIRNEEYFLKFIKQLKKKFINSLEMNFEIIKTDLFYKTSQISVKEKLNYSQLQKIFNDMIGKMFQCKYNYYDQSHQKLWKYELTDQISNFFYTPYRNNKKHHQKKLMMNNPLIKISSGIFTLAKNILSIPFNILKVFPQVKQEITSQRFQSCRVLYGLAVKKVNDFDFQNQLDEENRSDVQIQMLMNEKPLVARKLSLQSEMNVQQQRRNTTQMTEISDRQAYKFCKMILSEVQQTIQSLSFQSLVFYHATHKLQIFLNRVKMYMSKTKVTNIMVADFLPVAYKIVKQQIMISKQKRDQFYQAEILKSLRAVKAEQMNNNNEQMTNASYNVNIQLQQQHVLQLRNTILSEVYQNHEFEYLEKEFELKYFHQRNKIVFNPSKGKKSREEDDQIQQTLNMLVSEN